MKENNTIIWKFDKKENFAFVIPEDKQKNKDDFFVALRNSKNAWNGDIVEVVEIKNSKWKSREAKVVKIIEKYKIVVKEKNENTIEWVFSQWRGDFWFIDVEWIDKWFFVFSDNKNGALDWDKVEATTKVFKWKEEATVIRVIERKLDLIVWEYRPGKDNRFWFVVPNNPSVKTDIFVPGKFSMEAQASDIVWVYVTDWKWKNPEWVIKEIIWKKWDKKIDVLWLIIEWWARINFSDELISYAEKISSPQASPLRREGAREDLTKLFTFTIDWADAKDLDDAISIKILEKWWYKLYVHIADVSDYVKEWNLLDTEAYKRATSTYLVDRVIPMLPEKLSNDLCSLNPNTQKLTLTCEMTIWNNWKIQSQKVYESIISSDFRLTYGEVDEILTSPQPSPPKEREQEHKNVASFPPKGERIQERGSLKEWKTLLFWWKITTELIKKLQISNELKEKIKTYREWTWVLNFEFPETKIILDADWNPESIKEYPRYDSNKLIEEFMISANEAVSREFSSFPFLYRIHEEPKWEDLIKLQDTLNLFWIKFQFKNGNTKEFSNLLNSVSKLDEAKKMFLEKAVLRALSKAVYSKENFWHFGLWLSFYSHFTSPIRRYPDLQIHRIIKEKLAWKLNKSRVLYYENLLEKVSKHCSDKERKAEKLEYKVRDYYTVQFYKDKVWEEFDWVISWVLQKWFFVALKDTSEWFVELDRSEFVESLQEHVDLSTWKRYRLGEEIKIRLKEVDETMLRLNFELL